MTKKDHTAHQQNIIKRYYNNRDALMQQKLSELMTDLYLAEGKARDRLWKRIGAALTNLGYQQGQIDHLREQDNPVVLAEFMKKEGLSS